MKPLMATSSALLATCAIVLSAAVRTDYDHKIDFSRYHSYSWIGVKAGNSLWQNRITGAVDSALKSKGWSKVDSGGDAAISAFGKVSQQETLETFYNGFPGWGWSPAWWGGGIGTATTQVIPQRVGNLTVDIFDGHTKQLIFRGESTDTLEGDPQKNEKSMAHHVAEMLQKLPTGPKD